MRLRDEKASAMVEFAVVSMVLAVLVWWGHFFFDLLEVKMKLLEATRAALFEFTAYEMSDYNTGTAAGYSQRFNQISQQVQSDINNIYGTDLESTYPYRQSRTGLQRMTIQTATLGQPQLSRSTSLDQLVLTILNLFSQFTQVIPMNSFNQSGSVTATLTVAPTSLFALGQGAVLLTMRQTLSMLVDSWKLEDGCSVRSDGNYLTAQDGVITISPACQNKATASPRSTFSLQFSRLVRQAMTIAAPLAFDPANPDPKIASISFASGALNSFTQAEDGMMLETVSGQMSVRKFYTAPLCTFGAVGSCTQGDYWQAFNNRGNNFMGCPNEEAKDASGNIQAYCVWPNTPAP